MGCGMTTIKFLLFAFNIIFAFCGLAILVAGALIQASISEVNEFLEGKISAPPILLIVIGSIVFVIASFGCCGAIRESHCMIVTFAVLLIGILLVQVTVGVLAIVFTNDIDQEVLKGMKKVFDEDTDASREIFYSMQKEMECCGYEGPNNYDSPMVPASCCIEDNGAPCLKEDAYKVGCMNRVKEFIDTSGKVLGGIAIAIGAVEVVGIIFALCLANTIKHQSRRVR